MDFLQSMYHIQKKELLSKREISFMITQNYLIPEYEKIISRYMKKKNIMIHYNDKDNRNHSRDLSI